MSIQTFQLVKVMVETLIARSVTYVGFQKLASSPKWDHHLYKSGCFVGRKFKVHQKSIVVFPASPECDLAPNRAKFNGEFCSRCVCRESSRFLRDKHPVGLSSFKVLRCNQKIWRHLWRSEKPRQKKDRHMETSTHHINWQMDTKNDGPWKMYLGLEKLVSFWVSMMDLTLCSAFQNSFGKLGARNLLCCFSWQSCTTKRRFETIFYFYPNPWGTWSNLTCAYL